MSPSPLHPLAPSLPLFAGRLAPSPTGAQHVGNARTYLVAWLSARARGGAVKLRIEDIDSPRIKSGAAEQAMHDLHWLGLDWDGEPAVQTERLSHYEAALEVLKQNELVYPCTCTRSDIASAASAPHAGEEVTYPGTCAHRCVADALKLREEGRPFAWRFRVTENLPFTDRFAGEQHIDLKHAGGDFVVWKNGGGPAYQLAVVVDDAAMGVTEVVRGDDLIPSTPRQLLLYRALDLAPPAFAHIPLVVGEDGRRLAKRHGDTRLSALRAAGVKPEALVGLLAWSCGWLDRPEPVASRELLPRFRLESIPAKPFVLTAELLRQIGFVVT
ncbi:tRNA glutamyl-Q(34) synthetase GluQRS [Gemmata sp. G18]|uniref:Glutamyl-Q tRNA(Asp) synthetase n=1 Tax=Gemmata palustris TaxID=2822762 RepID=A0ABS5C3P2_9BACT|nr:tRNA glutamyl-Q(34) synthetase GluQRS [Gemmata palustris]MBP3960599.1 tRNA glutamyl-Q(34) synthetase GluQRS [Gemmata palustris]